MVEQQLPLLMNMLALPVAFVATGLLVREIKLGNVPLHLGATVASFAVACIGRVLTVVGPATGLADAEMEPALLPISTLANLTLLVGTLALLTGASASRLASRQAVVSVAGLAGSAFLTLQAAEVSLVNLVDAVDAAISAVVVSLFAYAVSRRLADQGAHWQSWAAAAIGGVFALAESAWWASHSLAPPIANVSALMMAFLYIQLFPKSKGSAEAPSSFQLDETANI